jgi:hypothetical protein
MRCSSTTLVHWPYCSVMAGADSCSAQQVPLLWHVIGISVAAEFDAPAGEASGRPAPTVRYARGDTTAEHQTQLTAPCGGGFPCMAAWNGRSVTGHTRVGDGWGFYNGRSASG